MAERTRIEQPAILRESESAKLAETPKAAEAPTPPAQQESLPRSSEREAPVEQESPPEPLASTAPEAKPGESGRPTRAAPEPALLVPDAVLPVGMVPIGVAHAQAGSGMFTVEFPNEVRTYYRARPDEGFSINASVSGKYRVTLRQPNEDGDLRIVGKSLTFDVQ